MGLRVKGRFAHLGRPEFVTLRAGVIVKKQCFYHRLQTEKLQDGLHHFQK